MPPVRSHTRDSGPVATTEVQYRVDDEVIARSERVILVAGAMQVTGITLGGRSVSPPVAENREMSTKKRSQSSQV